MKVPWLSVVTITKNDVVGLRRTLSSAAGLRAAGAEHHIIDGGEDMNLARESINECSEGIILHHRAPVGISDAFNAGLALARGEWVWFLNGGDAVHELLDPAWLSSLATRTLAQVVTGCVHYDGDAAPRSTPPLSAQWPLVTCWLAHPSTLVRRDALLQVGGFDKKWQIAMDYELWQRLLRPSTVVDVVAVPFARFALNGVSQREDMRVLVRREEALVVLTHSVSLIRTGIRLLWRLAHRLLWAVFNWRVRRIGRCVRIK